MILAIWLRITDLIFRQALSNYLWFINFSFHFFSTLQALFPSLSTFLFSFKVLTRFVFIFEPVILNYWHVALFIFLIVLLESCFSRSVQQARFLGFLVYLWFYWVSTNVIRSSFGSSSRWSRFRSLDGWDLWFPAAEGGHGRPSYWKNHVRSIGLLWFGSLLFGLFWTTVSLPIWGCLRQKSFRTL